jgi:hypothetical protein
VIAEVNAALTRGISGSAIVETFRVTAPPPTFTLLSHLPTCSPPV